MSIKKRRVALIYCYIGSWPVYFKFFLHTCKANQDVDFIIFTSNKMKGNEYADNIKFYDLDMAKFNELASFKLKLNINIKNSYKLCDFKPAYGYIFEDYIKDYDFWGFGDIDVIFGNINKFITPDILNEYDIISVRKEYLSGFFSIFRNKKKLRMLFTNSRDYKQVFQSEKHYCFDECNFAFSKLVAGTSIFKIRTEIQSMTEIILLEKDNRNVPVYFNTLVKENLGRYKWINGSIMDQNDNKEFLLLHLINHKSQFYFKFPKWRKIPMEFYINYLGFYESLSGWKFYMRDLALKLSYTFNQFKQTFILLFGGFMVNIRSIDIKKLKSYEGKYQYGNTVVAISICESSLYLNSNLKMIPISRSLFAVSGQAYLIKFKLDGQGNPIGMFPLSLPNNSTYSLNKIT